MTKLLHNVRNAVLKGICKFEIDTPKNARTTVVQSLEDPIHLYCGSPVSEQKNALHPIFRHNIIENSRNPFAHQSLFIVPNDFKFDIGCPKEKYSRLTNRQTVACCSIV